MKDLISGEHIAQFYYNDESLATELTTYIAGGFEAGETCVVVATEEHLHMVEIRLALQQYDLKLLQAQGRYIKFDAQQLLSTFMVNNWPDNLLFEAAILPVLQEATESNRQVRAFGEMVSILWKRGLNAATIHLEHLWNEILAKYNLTLFCAYPISSFNYDLSSSAQHVCKAHSRIIEAS